MSSLILEGTEAAKRVLKKAYIYLVDLDHLIHGLVLWLHKTNAANSMWQSSWAMVSLHNNSMRRERRSRA